MKIRNHIKDEGQLFALRSIRLRLKWATMRKDTPIFRKDKSVTYTELLNNSWSSRSSCKLEYSAVDSISFTRFYPESRISHIVSENITISHLLVKHKRFNICIVTACECNDLTGNGLYCIYSLQESIAQTG